MEQESSRRIPLELIDRLRRIEGQVRGLQKMVRQGRAPSEVIYQIAAVKSALEQAALWYLTWEAQQQNGSEETVQSVRNTLQLIAKVL